MNRSRLDAWVMHKEGVKRLDRSTIEEIQLRKLNGLLLREEQRGGFYKGLPGQLGSLEELAGLPFTTEEELKSQGNRMLLLSQAQVERVRTENTSGTTGAVKRVFYSEGDSDRTVSFFEAGLSELVFPKEKVMICMPFSGKRGLGELIAEAVENLGAQPLSAGIGRTYGELLELLEREQPQAFVGMPVPLLSLLRLKPDSSLQRALVSADACPPSVVKELRGRLSGFLYPHYGSRELGLGGAVTCPAFEGMHLRENDVIAEIVDGEGRVLPKGEWGELVITTVQAEAMPLIRYRTGDFTRIIKEPCPCGSRLLRLDTVRRLGAGKDMAALDDSMFSCPELIDYRVREREGYFELEGFVREQERAEQWSFPAEWNGEPVKRFFRQAKRTDSPCYAAKRRVL